MLDHSSIDRVDRFGEALQSRLGDVGDRGDWGGNFKIEKSRGSDYWRIQVDGIKKNWLQLNGHTYFHPSYSSPKPWKLQARFLSSPDSPLWEKKPPYVYSRKPNQEWSLGGLDVWAISYERLADSLTKDKEEEVMDEILQDLKVSWAYANGKELPTGFAGSSASGERVEVSISVDSKIWAEFEQTYARWYQSRKRHPKRPSYAELRKRAVDEAFRDCVTKYKN